MKEHEGTDSHGVHATKDHLCILAINVEWFVVMLANSSALSTNQINLPHNLLKLTAAK